MTGEACGQLGLEGRRPHSPAGIEPGQDGHGLSGSGPSGLGAGVFRDLTESL